MSLKETVAQDWGQGFKILSGTCRRCTTVLSSGAPSPRSAVVPPCSHGCFRASRAVGRCFGSLGATADPLHSVQCDVTLTAGVCTR